jgi:mevalonate kinase
VQKRFYSNGKLLLTGEYVVLDGAKALALPTTFGQDLTVTDGANRVVSWKSFDADGSIWFEGVISFDEIENGVNQAGGASIKNTLIEILHAAWKMSPSFTASDGYFVETRLTFPRLWGLGTSSTLINNVAQWLGVDAFALLAGSFGGSGYDIACAQNDTPVMYHLTNGKPVVEPVSFDPAFADRLHFVYLNRKQSSKAAVASYYANREEDLDWKVKAVSHISENLLHVADAGSFARELDKHESIISEIVEMQTVKETFFSDFPGVVKSLGGWGGDFVLAVSKDDPVAYFHERGFKTVIPYREMILS